MGKVINLKNRAQVLNWHLADVEINGRQLEIGIETVSNEPMVIDWARKRAWVGGWDELVEMVAADLEQEEPEDAAHKSA